jgi:cytochrome oxidase Cu insertion factor (SCO1/SenC/PrrC family)
MRALRFPSLLWSIMLGVVCIGADARGVFAGSGPWLDHRGQPFGVDTLSRAPSVVSMSYGACRRVCSASLRTMQQLQALADARGVALNFVVIGLDPQQDRPADWAALRAERRLDRANWQFLSGGKASTAAMAQRLGVRYWTYGEHTMHDFRIVLVSAEGQIVREMNLPDQDPATLLP